MAKDRSPRRGYRAFRETDFFGSVSIGAASLSDTMKSTNDLLKSADGAVYRAKKNGRNRVSS